MSKMFCFQCEQTAKGTGCTEKGVCGKTPEVANKQDELTAALIGLARAAKGLEISEQTNKVMMDALFVQVTNVSFDEKQVAQWVEKVQTEKAKYGTAPDFKKEELWSGNEDIVSLRSTLLLGMRGMAAYACHAYALGKQDNEVSAWLLKEWKRLEKNIV